MSTEKIKDESEDILNDNKKLDKYQKENVYTKSKLYKVEKIMSI